MKMTKVRQNHKNGNTYTYDYAEFRARYPREHAGMVEAAKVHMKTTYGVDFSSPVFLNMLCAYWITGKRPKLDTKSGQIKVLGFEE